MNCHASALGLQGTYASTEFVTATPALRTGDEPEIFDNIHQRFARLADPVAIEASRAPRDTIESRIIKGQR
jgi:hypothetical protein